MGYDQKYSCHFVLDNDVAGDCVLGVPNRSDPHLFVVENAVLAQVTGAQRLFPTRYSAVIVGCLLTQTQVVANEKHFSGWEGDQLDALRYLPALENGRKLAKAHSPLTEAVIRSLPEAPRRAKGVANAGEACPLPQCSSEVRVFHNMQSLRIDRAQYIVRELCGSLRPGAKRRWESGENPELPRSGKQERTPTWHWLKLELGSRASRQPASPKTCHEDIRLRLRGEVRWQWLFTPFP